MVLLVHGFGGGSGSLERRWRVELRQSGFQRLETRCQRVGVGRDCRPQQLGHGGALLRGKVLLRHEKNVRTVGAGEAAPDLCGSRISDRASFRLTLSQWGIAWGNK